MNPLLEMTARKVISDLTERTGLAVVHVAKYDLPKRGIIDPYQEESDITSVDLRRDGLLDRVTKRSLANTLDIASREVRTWNLRENAQQMAVGMCSATFALDGSLGHIPMIDIDLPATANNIDCARAEANQVLEPGTEVYILRSSHGNPDKEVKGGMHLYAHVRNLPTLEELVEIQSNFTGSDPQHVERTASRGYAVLRVDAFPPLKPTAPTVVAYFQTTGSKK